ncbi:alpha/beta hydrolase [Luteimonas gilva]|uniref:Alpha/beta hydrolase n=1 Tax=Luteimonas gilva TaxID=2572684 RepID=A0A4U5JSN2_9GAMM|nr:alpha/beta hydrolase [Luteimonas gilva]TKR31057.1 alpha/beta hydrolase [Luteimonas gilva]
MRRFPASFWGAVLFLLIAAPLQVFGTPASGSAEPPPGFESRFVQANGVRLHFVVGGKGPPLLLIHGWPETWYEWRRMLPRLAERFTVVAPDLRGFGDSELAASGYDKKTLAQDMHALMASLGYRSAVVAGHDWGAPVAYAYAAQHRDEVSKLIMIEGAPFGPWMADTNPMWFFDFLRIPGYAESVVDGGREAAFLRFFYDNEAMHAVPGSFDEATIGIYTRGFERPGRMGPSYGLYRTIDRDVADNAEFAKRPLSIPILAVGADKGNGALIENNSRRVGNRVSAVLFRNTGHFIPEERPDALVDTLSKFVDGETLDPEWRP